jgi:hypothetical protein
VSLLTGEYSRQKEEEEEEQVSLPNAADVRVSQGWQISVFNKDFLLGERKSSA